MQQRTKEIQAFIINEICKNPRITVQEMAMHSTYKRTTLYDNARKINIHQVLKIYYITQFEDWLNTHHIPVGKWQLLYLIKQYKDYLQHGDY